MKRARYQEIRTPPKRSRQTVQRIVKKAVRQAHELKAINSSFGKATNVLKDSTTNYLLNAIAEGTAADTRQGRDVMIESIQGWFSFEGTGAGLSDSVRVVVVWDREPRGAQFSFINDVLANNVPGQTITSAFKQDNKHRFKIIHDKTVDVEGKSSVAGTFGVKHHRFYHKIGMLSRYYDANNVTIADIDAGALFIYFVSGYGTGGVPTVDVTGSVSLQFRDR